MSIYQYFDAVQRRIWNIAIKLEMMTTYTPTNKNLNEQVPLLWTRGLLATGKWDTALGVWGSTGGHIAFGDAHVDWRADTSSAENQFASKKTPGTTTINWTDAVTASTVRELKSK